MCENSLIHIQQKLKSLNRLLIKSSVISYPSSVEFTYLIDQKKSKNVIKLARYATSIDHALMINDSKVLIIKTMQVCLIIFPILLNGDK
ncbi:unnamed protein product [Brassica rapa]|uniref:Uncharacterized protein n=2 Tax=Brassica TaxID=3705 RepID=A0A3P5YHB0_BRACM|nr:unnamed protein product [Brassica napus]CAG7866006.1 unnamed protein product [Brassica rapa]VDC63034.1 unnamed protein product [Brassica rapa]